MSSSAPAVSVRGLSKAYAISAERPRATTLAEAIAERLRAPLRPPRAQTFWALREISFQVDQGELIGIVGRNGAGKSTLLKILSRITEPTCGEARLRGRVGSLLEVGTGFHPELTGRENVYLNGVLLGMRRREVARRFDEIVAFSGIERFIDTPVKRYSTGMCMRLAFAVAAHLDAETLIIDEVLAVGDADFQAKCMGKMSELTVRSGRTVLLVSHNLAAVRSLCSRCLLLADGQLVLDGPVNEVVSRYAARTGVKPGRADTVFNRPPNVNLWMRQASLLSDGRTGEGIESGSRIQVRVEFEADAGLLEPRLGIVISSSIGDPLLATNNRFQQSAKLPDRPIRRGTISCDLGVLPLMPGDYTASLWLGDGGHDTHVEKDALAFRLDERDIWGRGVLPPRVAPLWWPATFRIGD